MIEAEVNPMCTSSSSSSLGSADVDSLEATASHGFSSQDASANTIECPRPPSTSLPMVLLTTLEGPSTPMPLQWIASQKRVFLPMSVLEYEWLSGKVETYHSQFCTWGVMAKLVKEVLLTLAEHADLFFVEPCATNEKLGVILPYDAFEVDMLNRLNVNPSQLHLNRWAAMQTFRVICHYLQIESTATKFAPLHHAVELEVRIGLVDRSPRLSTQRLLYLL
ncbi:hypothetical protein CR513_51192, partial [Mucuna pruriens]